MDNTQYQTMVQEAVKGRFRGKTELVSKAVPRYPMQAEREYQRVARAYVRTMNRVLKAYLPEILKEYRAEQMRNDSAESRFDSHSDFRDWLKRLLLGAADKTGAILDKLGIDKLIDKIGKMTHKRTVDEWERVVRSALGVDIAADYYSGGVYSTLLNVWVAENVNKIKSIPQESFGRMEKIILDGFLSGASEEAIQKRILKEFDVTKSKAAMLARDQIGTLNAQIAKQQHADAGIEKYMWETRRDDRVRPCHRSLDGQIFRWDDPPEMWYETKTLGIVYTGRRCHPGEDYGCRCRAIPVFDLKKINLPFIGKKS